MNKAKALRTSGWVLLLVGTMVLASCSGQAPHPQDVLATYVENVRAKRVEAIYDTLGESVRRDMSEAQFADFFAANYPEILAEAEQIERALQTDKLGIRAAVPVQGGGEVALAYEDDAWRLQDEVPINAAAANPRSTLVELADAVDRGDFNEIMTMLSQEKRDTLRAELGIIRASLGKISEDDVLIDGNSAVIYLDFNLKLELLYEDGGWRLHRLSQQ